MRKIGNKYQPFWCLNFPLGAILVHITFGDRFPKGMVEIIVPTVKRHNFQNGGTQKIHFLKYLIFVSNLFVHLMLLSHLFQQILS